MPSIPSRIVVVIGAEGSMNELFTMFSTELPQAFAYVIVQQLPADFKARLDDLAHLKVVTVRDKQAFAPGTLYLLPSKTVSLINGRFRVRSLGQNTLADKFLNSLAKAFGNKIVGLILAGTNLEGLDGIRAIKNSGGIVLVRNPNTTGFSQLPANTIAFVAVDSVLEPEALPQYLQGLIAD